MHRFARALALSLALPACDPPTPDTSADGGADAVAPDFAVLVCQRYDACMIGVANCVATYRARVFSDACQSGALSASCSDLSSPSSTGPLAACEPPCDTPGTTACNADGTFSECTASSIADTWHCEGLCATKGQTYSGTCGVMFDGEMSNAPQCWCK